MKKEIPYLVIYNCYVMLLNIYRKLNREHEQLKELEQTTLELDQKVSFILWQPDGHISMYVYLLCQILEKKGNKCKA